MAKSLHVAFDVSEKGRKFDIEDYFTNRIEIEMDV
jgi:hypothetical protein